MSGSPDTFAAQVADRARHAVADYSIESSTLLILFGGIAGGVSMPVYEFFRVTEGYPVKRLFLRDPRHSWYLRGLPGVGDDAESIRAGLEEAIRRAEVSRVVMAGASAGGFAALRFGSQLGADRILAFSPQTFIDAPRRVSSGDDRWEPQIAALHAALGEDSPEFDVVPPVTEAAGVRCSVHVSGDEPMDLWHAQRLAGLENVDITVHDRGGHLLVRFLRDNGDLPGILTEALTEPPAGS